MVAYTKLSPGPGMATGEVKAHQRERIQRALIEVVAERGYASLKVRDLVKLAGVSTRAFYESFESKEDCFLHTHRMVARRAAREIVAAQVGEEDWRQRPRRIYEALAKEMQEDPAAARLVLTGGTVAGPAALEQSRRFEEMLTGMIGESFARGPNGIVVPDLVVEGMVAGVGRVVRARLMADRQEELLDIESEVMDWVLSFPSKYAQKLTELDSQSVWRDTRLSNVSDEDPWAANGDRGLILSAVAEFATESSHEELTVTRICRAAGVSRKAFSSHFEDVEDAFVATLDQHADKALAQALRAQAAGRTWTGCTYRTIAALCDQIHEDPLLVRTCLSDDFAPGTSAARTRSRLVTPIAEQLSGAPPDRRPAPLAAEASVGSIWSILFHHVIRAETRVRRPRVSATLAFLATAPGVGAPDAFARIRREQVQHP